MNQINAGGQITQPTVRPGAESLETDLHNVADAIAGLLGHARDIAPDQDEFGHARSRHYSDAVALLKASAKVGHTIAELRGSKFEHNINVRREGTETKSISPEDEEESTFMWLDSDTLYDWRSKQTYVLDKSRGPGGRPLCEPLGGATPLPISEGSNGNFAEPEAD